MAFLVGVAAKYPQGTNDFSLFLSRWLCSGGRQKGRVAGWSCPMAAPSIPALWALQLGACRCYLRLESGLAAGTVGFLCLSLLPGLGSAQGLLVITWLGFPC